MNRSRTVAAIAVVGAAATVGGTASAQAVATPTERQPITVVVSGSVTTLSLPVLSSAGGRQHIVTLKTPSGRPGATGTSRSARLTVSGTPRSTALEVGSGLRWTLTDTDRSVKAVTVNVLDQNLVTLRSATLSRGQLRVIGTVTHYDATANRYVADRRVVVELQVQSRSRWVSIANLTTSRSGAVDVTLRASVARGASVRLVLHPTTTETGGTSQPTRVR
jgi:hypothetical protein